jgi:hypothetical protein
MNVINICIVFLHTHAVLSNRRYTVALTIPIPHSAIYIPHFFIMRTKL